MTSAPTKKARVYEQIHTAIIRGELKPGEILNEAELSQRYGVGKTPTREALILLTHERFLESMPRVGYIVAKPTIQDILDTFHLRLVLEVEAIGLSTDRISEEVINNLVANNQEEKEILQTLSGEELKERASELNRQFHFNIVQACGNMRLTLLVQQLIDDMGRMLSYDPYIADPTQHQAILEAIQQRDKQKAQEAMHNHIEETRTRILNRF